MKRENWGVKEITEALLKAKKKATADRGWYTHSFVYACSADTIYELSYEPSGGMVFAKFRSFCEWNASKKFSEQHEDIQERLITFLEDK